MSAVVEAVEGVFDAVDKYIIQPIADDPLTFIATAAAAYFLGPLAAAKFGVSGAVGTGIAAGAGNTAAGLVQGEDFDEAIKGGALAGVTTWAGSALAGASTPSSSTAALQKGITSTADDFGSAALQSTDDILKQVATGSADDYLVQAGTTYGDDLVAGAAKDWGRSLGDDVLNLADEGVQTPFGKVSTPAQAPVASTAPAPAPSPGSGVYTGQKIPGMGDAAVNPANYLDEAAAGGRVPPPSQFDNPFDDPLYYEKLSAQQNAIPRTAAETSADVLESPMLKLGSSKAGMQTAPVPPTAWDKALGYGKDAYNLVVDNPMYSVPLGLTALSYLGKDKDDEPDGSDLQNKQVGDESFYRPLDLLKMRREQTPYQDDIYSYGVSSGEGQFFTPTVYEPEKYANGGQVTPRRDDYGYYTYGEIPQTMRRFAKGGLSALAKGGSFDGRSDDIPAVLSDGEFVIDAETVALLGNGSSKAGANRLEEMRQSVRKQKGGALSQGKFSADAKHPLAYLKSSKRGRG